MNRRKQLDVLLDVCTQRDYLTPDGARPTRNAGQTLVNLKRIMALARWAKVPTLSCIDLRRPGEVCTDKPVCVEGTRGQEKISFSLLPDHVTIEPDNCLSVPLDVLDAHQQVIVAKGSRDPFANPKLDRLLTEMPAPRFVLFGVALEETIRQLALGLMLRHREIVVVVDACAYWDDREAAMVQRQLSAKGCAMLTTQQFLDGIANRLGRRLNGRRYVA